MPQNTDRKVSFYFAKQNEPGPSRDDVADFIMSDMGLVRRDNAPKWTDGLLELIDLGMDAYEGEIATAAPDTNARIKELEDQVAGYRREVQQLQNELDQRRQKDDALDAADRVHRIEARILEVLCRDDHQGAHSMNYVDLYELVDETGLQADSVKHYAEMLSKPEHGERTQLDRLGERVKATSPSAFTGYCDSVGLDTDVVEARNK